MPNNVRVEEVRSSSVRGCFLLTDSRTLVSTRLVGALATWLLLSAFAQVVKAADPIGNLDTPVVIKAREQPVARFLGELFGQMGVPVSVAENVQGAVNGDFDKSAGKVLEQVRKAFQLTYYYDGAVVHVYPSSDLSREILYVSSEVGTQVMANARTLELPDSQNRLELKSVGLVATGTARFLEQVRELSNGIESRSRPGASPETFRVFRLTYGWADDVSLVIGGQKVVVPGVASLLANLVGAEGVGDTLPTAVPGGVAREPISPAQPKLKGEGLQSIGAESGAAAGDGEQEPIDPLELTTTPAANPKGRVRIVADPLNNAVVVRDRADRMESYERLIDTLDVEPMMVEIEATIIDMNTDRLRELGIQWRLQSDDVQSMVGPDALSDPTPIGEGGVVSLVLGDQTRFISRIRALESQGAARVVSRPHVITLANVEALLDSTSTFFVRVEGQEEVDLFDVTVGTTMRVTPHVLARGGRSEIKLLVGIEDGSATDQRVDRIPVIDRSTINTQALVQEGQSLLIGGLIRESDTDSVSKVPLLGDIPGIGRLFRSNSRSNNQTERLFLITPRLTPQVARGSLRLDEPIVSGDDEEIIRSAPLRLESARAALSERDARFPTPELAPGGLTAEPRVTSRAEPLDDSGASGENVTGEKEPTTTDFKPFRLERVPKPGARERVEPDSSDEPTPAAPTEELRALTVSDRQGERVTRTVPVSPLERQQGWSEVPGSRPPGQ